MEQRIWRPGTEVGQWGTAPDDARRRGRLQPGRAQEETEEQAPEATLAEWTAETARKWGLCGCGGDYRRFDASYTVRGGSS